MIDALRAEYPGFDEFDATERALLIAAHYADTIKVREATGHNDGLYVERFLRTVGLHKGYPWCAAFVYACYREAGVATASLPIGGAAVRNWVKSPLVHKVPGPVRGDLGYWLNPNGTGHIFFCVRTEGAYVHTIEGNTDGLGSREGNGCFRRLRPINKVKYLRFIP